MNDPYAHLRNTSGEINRAQALPTCTRSNNILTVNFPNKETRDAALAAAEEGMAELTAVQAGAGAPSNPLCMEVLRPAYTQTATCISCDGRSPVVVNGLTWMLLKLGLHVDVSIAPAKPALHCILPHGLYMAD